MILLRRGMEPPELSVVRNRELVRIRQLGRPPTSREIDGYRVVSASLWKQQHYKCCYCENKIQLKFNDVDHYRPKSSADRLPGCNQKHGYWWLAFSWANLLFACAACNRAGKNDQFPTAMGSTTLTPEEMPPGREAPLLLDPYSANPLEHIQFVSSSSSAFRHGDWWARPRANSVLGCRTIEVCDLNRADLRELRNDYVERVLAPYILALVSAVDEGDAEKLNRVCLLVRCLLKPENQFVGLSYDVLRTSIPASIPWPAIIDISS